MYKPAIKGLLVIMMSIVAASSQGQVIPRTLPAAYTSEEPVNYVRTWDMLVPESDANSISTATTIDKARMTTQYIDGLGRPLQTVVKGITPLGKDMVSAVEYDAFGREQYKYLPFAANTAGGNASVSDGMFKLNPFVQQAAFYSNTDASLNPIAGQTETFFYGQTQFEASPLNRVTKALAPGNSWIGVSKGVEVQYQVNTQSEDIRIWTVSSTVSAVPTSSAAYPTGELYKTITLDENLKQVVEYKDKEGKLILKKVQLSNTPGITHTGWLCTYYVYDDLDNLRFVLPPKAVEDIIPNWTVSSVVRDELCFYYGYDSRNRMVVKKVPGAGEVWMVYDKRDRLVMSQDANLRTTGKWLVTLYDELNRPVKTGLWTESNSRTYHEAQAANTANYYYPFTSSTIPASGFELLTETGYDNYASLPAGAPTGSLDDTYITSANFFTTYDAAPYYAQSIIQSLQTQGVVTWTKVKVLGSSPEKYLCVVNIYDEKGRLIQVKSKNLSDGTDIITTQYDFSGKVLKSHIAHQKSGANPNIYQVLTTNKYDLGGRVTDVVKKVNSQNEVTITKNSYDELGQLNKKELGRIKNPDGVSYTSSPIEMLTYDYNIRGWLLGANRDYAKSTTSTSNYFGFDLGYDKQTIASLGNYTATQLNGNIAGMVWKSTGDDQVRKYDFSYDNVNRLSGAVFTQHNGGFNTSQNIDYSVSNLTYDVNGNILTQSQKGWKLTGSDFIDQLSYTYPSSSNKLKNVVDANNDATTKLGDFRASQAYLTTLGGTKTSSATDYLYDSNGNLTSDKNKDITSITYNHLNLPSLITTAKGTIAYTYDAGGNKLKKIVSETGKPVKTTLYLFGTYEDEILQFLPMEEGRIRLTTSTTAPFVYDYMIKDHLGNVRMVLTEEQQTDAYLPASMETAQATTEESFYSNLPATRVDKPAGYPNDTYTNPNDKVAKLRGDGQKIGPGIVLKVMAGDKFNIRANSWYKLNGATPGAPVNPLTDLVAALAGSIGAITGTHGGATETEIANSGVLTPGATDFLNSQAIATGKPKAFLNWVLFDEQFKFVSSSSGAEPVGNDLEFKTHTKTGMPVDKSGYLYIYVSNETPNIDVFFDNLQVTHIRGPILEETHYYPFGLQMQGISSQNANSLENKHKYNGIEKENDLAIEIYDAQFRELDPQTARWWQIDPVTDGYESISPYASMYNNPITYSDPLGNEGEECCLDEIINAVDDLLISTSGIVNGALNTVSGGLISSDPANLRDRLSEDKLDLYDRSVQVVQIGLLFMPGGSRGSVKTPSLRLIDGPVIPVPVVLKPVLIPMSNAGEGGNNKKISSNEKLIEDAKQQKAKEQQAQQRQQNRQQATQQGKQKEGKSNQDVKGSHHKGKGNKDKYDPANARRAREQKAAEEKKKKS